MSMLLLDRFKHTMSNTAERKLVKFLLAETWYAVDIMLVREIVLPRAVQKIIGQEAYLMGVVDHRHSAVPVVDLRIKIDPGFNSAGSKEKWIIVNANDRDIALVVSEIEGVVTVLTEQERNKDVVNNIPGSAWTKRVYGTEEGLLFELNLDEIVVSKVEG